MCLRSWNVDFLRIRDGLQWDDVGMWYLDEDLFLREKVFDLVLFDDLLFPHDFEGVDLSFIFELDEFDSPEGTIAQGA